MRPRRLAAALLAAALTSTALPAALASADDITPVDLAITIAPVARLHQPLAVRVGITADAGVLNSSSAMYMRVKLATECGGSYATTPGVSLLNAPLKPQPATGKSYIGAVKARTGRPTAYGVLTVCAYLEESGDNREYATSQALSVNVSKPCTVAAAAYDRAAKALKKAQKRKQGVAHAQAVAKRNHTKAAKACGPGVPL